jgi:hypothetical protein
MSEENSESVKPITNEFIDKVTLELLMNKNHYNRYLSQTDPKKHQEHLNHLEKIRKYRNKIINTTTDFLNNPEHQITTEVNEAFDHYVRTLIRHFECKEMENHEESSQDEDTLFGNMEEPLIDENPTMKSYWGKNKVVKKGNQMGFPMNYIPRVKETEQDII